MKWERVFIGDIIKKIVYSWPLKKRNEEKTSRELSLELSQWSSGREMSPRAPDQIQFPAQV